MLDVLEVKKANYYKWLKHEKSKSDLENEELAEYIKKYDEKFNHTHIIEVSKEMKINITMISKSIKSCIF